MMALLSWRVWAALALLAVLAASHFTMYRKGVAHERTANLAAKAEANSESRRLEQARQSAADAASRDAAARETRILAAAANARTESSGLRDDLSSARQFAKESRAAAERVADLATDLLGRCEASYLGVAEAAARADSEARTLRQAWPK